MTLESYHLERSIYSMTKIIRVQVGIHYRNMHTQESQHSQTGDLIKGMVL